VKQLRQNLVKYRELNRLLNSTFPDATAEELAASDTTCIVCMEEMTPPGPKRLPCGHILHVGCLRSWFEKQQVW
jgi:E3 ubiquitin-protein ligase synoviolin